MRSSTSTGTVADTAPPGSRGAGMRPARPRPAPGPPTRRGRGARDRADLLEDVTRILVRQVADVDDHGAEVRDLVERVAALDPPEVDRGPVEQLGRLARERQGLDSPEHLDRLQHRVVAQPRGG